MKTPTSHLEYAHAQPAPAFTQGASLSHTCVQDCALVGNPVFAAHVGVDAVFLASIFLSDTKVTELLIHLYFDPKFLNDDLRIHGIIQEANARNMVWN